MKEGNISNLIMMAISKVCGTKVFRNHVGLGWQGETKRTKSGGIFIDNPRPLHSGLCKGSSDLIGWTPIEITPEMVGKKIAVFTAIEVKTIRGRVSKEQINFLNQINLDGGIATIATSPEQAVDLINNMTKNVKN